MGRVHHGLRHVDRTDEVLPVLADPYVGRGGRGRPEDIEGHVNTRILQFGTGVLQKPLDDVPSTPAVGTRVGGSEEMLWGCVRKADVVPLDFGEAHRGRLLRQVDVVIPDSLVVQVGPEGTVAVHPDAARCVLHRPFPLRMNQKRILDHHDAGDRIDARLLEPLEKRRQVPNTNLLICARLTSRHHLGRITHVARGILEVDHKGVYFGPGRQIDEGLGPGCRPSSPGVQINALHRFRPDELQGLLRKHNPRHLATPTGAGGRGRKVFADRFVGEPGQGLHSRVHLRLVIGLVVGSGLGVVVGSSGPSVSPAVVISPGVGVGVRATGKRIPHDLDRGGRSPFERGPGAQDIGGRWSSQARTRIRRNGVRIRLRIRRKRRRGHVPRKVGRLARPGRLNAAPGEEHETRRGGEGPVSGKLRSQSQISPSERVPGQSSWGKNWVIRSAVYSAASR